MEQTRPQLGEIAIGGWKDITKPYVGALEHPLDYITQRALNDPAVFDEILRDDQVKSTFGQRVRAVTSREWHVVPGDDSRAAKKAASALTEMLVALRFDNLTEKMLYALFYGYSVAEIVWQTDSASWSWRAIKVRNRRRFRFGTDGQLRLLTRADVSTGEIMPAANFWTLSAGADNDDEPYGRGLAQWLYWPVFFKRNGLRYWLTFLEKFAAPTAVARHPAGASSDDVDKALAAAEAITLAAAIAMPDTMTLDLLEATRSGGGDYKDHHLVQNAAISKIVLGQTMTTDDGSSLSQSKVHMEVRQDIVEADADWLNESFNAGPVKTWAMLNYGPDVAPPRVERVFAEPEDLDNLAERDVKLRQLGWRRTADSFTETFGDGYEPDTTPSEQAPAEPPANLADPEPVRDTVDRAVDVLLAGDGWRDFAGPMIEPLIGHVRAAVEAGETLEQVRDRLQAQAPAILDQIDSSALTEAMARAGFVLGTGVRIGAVELGA